MLKDEYTIRELAKLAGTSPRTIRYYQQEGLLPEPVNRGKYAYYNNDHLVRLRLIQELKNSYFPLKEIRARLNALTTHQVQSLLESQATTQMRQPAPSKVSDNQPVQSGSDTALDYISRLLKTQSELRHQEPPKAPPAPPANQHYVAGTPTESWRHIALAPRIEIHIQEPISPLDQQRLEELVKFARKLFT